MSKREKFKKEIPDFTIMKTIAIEAPLEYFDDLIDIPESDESIRKLNLDYKDEDDFDIEDADIGVQDDIETGEFGNNADEESPDDWVRAKSWQADIKFRIEDNIIKYQIYLGNLVFNKNKDIVKARRDAMMSMAEFLKTKQEKFLLSPDIKTADENLRSMKQKDFFEFCNAIYPNEKKDSGWASKAVKNKNIQAPFSRRLIPISDLFDSLKEKVMILKKAIDCHLCSNISTPLSASDQSKILSCFLGQDDPGYISDDLWPRLRIYYDKSNWESIRLVGGKAGKDSNDDKYLLEIANNVSLHMGKPIKRRSIFDIEQNT
jgi:hypothetical protein